MRTCRDGSKEVIGVRTAWNGCCNVAGAGDANRFRSNSDHNCFDWTTGELGT